MPRIQPVLRVFFSSLRLIFSKNNEIITCGYYGTGTTPGDPLYSNISFRLVMPLSLSIP